jgi:hypothetical protein
MVLLAVAMPPVLYTLLDPDVTENATDAALRSVVGIAAYTAACATTTHAVFELAPRRLLEGPPGLRILGMATALAVAVALATLLVFPLVRFVCAGMTEDGGRLMLQGIVISWLYASAGVMVGAARTRLFEARERAHAEREIALESRLRALTARTNPHFLFNSINAGMSLIAIDPERAEQHFGRLSAVFRHTLEASARRFVRLEDELDVIRDYLEIERARFGERLRYELRVEPTVLHEHVPPMLIQPLVENAVLHGVSSRVEGGELTLDVERDGEVLVITVTDDGTGAAARTHRGSGTALRDLRERLDILFGGAASLSVGRASHGAGFRAELRVPLRTAR